MKSVFEDLAQCPVSDAEMAAVDEMLKTPLMTMDTEFKVSDPKSIGIQVCPLVNDPMVKMMMWDTGNSPSNINLSHDYMAKLARATDQWRYWMISGEICNHADPKDAAYALEYVAEMQTKYANLLATHEKMRAERKAGAKCIVCGNAATSYCGKCLQDVYYCSRACQKKDWKRHKPYCT